MPYKNPQDKKKAWDKWRGKNPNYWKKNRSPRNDEERQKDKMRKRSQRATPTKRKCEVSGCSKMGERHHSSYGSQKVRWLCRDHHAKV